MDTTDLLLAWKWWTDVVVALGLPPDATPEAVLDAATRGRAAVEAWEWGGHKVEDTPTPAPAASQDAPCSICGDPCEPGVKPGHGCPMEMVECPRCEGNEVEPCNDACPCFRAPADTDAAECSNPHEGVCPRCGLCGGAGRVPPEVAAKYRDVPTGEKGEEGP